MTNVEAQRVRVQAMRIAHRLSYFDRDSYLDREEIKSRGVNARYKAPPVPNDWSFIDLDPLLGGVDEILMDDGARATWPVDYSQCLPLDENGNWRIVRGHSVSPQDARKDGCRVFSNKMMKVEQVSFQDGMFDFGGATISLLGGRWVDAHRGPVSSSKDMMGGRNGCKNVQGFEGDMIAGSALRLRYEWSAIFSFPTGINLRFGTSSAGALALFRDRDKDLDSQRRFPLLHWVRRHWRRSKTTADSLTEIKKHLRGAEQITWAGMPVIIVPSEYEVEQSIAA